jgi:translation initiation factor RLI1
MIIQNAGREGDDHYKRFITDEFTYISMVQYIKSLIPVSFETKIQDVVDPEEEIEKLDKFYDGELNGYFSRY